MKIEQIQVAVSEAQRFIGRANLAIHEAKENGYGLSCIPKETGSLRRSSLDLTRALAEMRKQ